MTKIYIQLFDEGTTVWRPVNAEHVRVNIYRISTELDPKILDEVWEFRPGDVVFCDRHIFQDGSEGLVAVRLSTTE